ncbi:MAG: flagellar basal body L-ring protein FlgH [Sedimentisphaerales bacterium]|nr:flagellar basal body L-ring protein FlgH [Sedimentisphaerales bacterium]
MNLKTWTIKNMFLTEVIMLSGWRLVQVGLIIAIAGTYSFADSPTNSIYNRAVSENRNQRLRSFAGDSSGNSNTMGNSSVNVDKVDLPRISGKSASWIAVDKPRPKDVRVHDLVTIIVNEVSKHSSKEDTKSEREYSIDAALQDWLRYSSGSLRPDKQPNGDPKIGLSYEREFEGKGDNKRSDTLSARIQAEVIDVMPNGNLILEATHKVVTNEEETVITLTGTCRSKDVGVDNTIISTQLARLDVRKHHKGIVRDANKRGLLSGLIDWLAIF